MPIYIFDNFLDPLFYFISGPNSAVSYSLAYLHDFFGVDEMSGAIMTKKDLAFHGASADNTYRLGIIHK